MGCGVAKVIAHILGINTYTGLVLESSKQVRVIKTSVEKNTVTEGSHILICKQRNSVK